jgi:outer membrane protein OmpA-like peptidoglycan-associated protein/uncharacterized protein YcfJ
MRKTLIKLTAITVAISTIVGCANVQQFANDLSMRMASSQGMTVSALPDNPCEENRRQQLSYGRAFLGGAVGAVGGALAGALLGEVFKGADKNKLMAAGAVAGAAVGAKVGYDAGFDTYRRQCEVYKIAQSLNTQAAFVTLQLDNKPAGEITVTPSEEHFQEGTAVLTSKGLAYYKAVAQQYTNTAQLRSYLSAARSAQDTASSGQAKTGTPANAPVNLSAEDSNKLTEVWSQMRIVLTGHTDDSWDAAEAVTLSEERANVVATLFKDAGVPATSLMYQGAGSALPIADNANSNVRQLNNRIEVVVLAKETNIEDYGSLRTSSPELLNPIPGTKSRPTRPTLTTAGGATTKLNKQPVKPAGSNVAKNPITKTTQATPVAVNKQQPTNPANVYKAPTTSATAAKAAKPDELNYIDFSGQTYSASTPQVVTKLGKLKSAPITVTGVLTSLLPIVGIGEARASQGGIPASCTDDSSYRYNVKSGEIKRLGSAVSVSKNKANIDHNDLYWHNRDIQLVGDVGSHLVVVRCRIPDDCRV